MNPSQIFTAFATLVAIYLSYRLWMAQLQREISAARLLAARSEARIWRDLAFAAYTATASALARQADAFMVSSDGMARMAALHAHDELAALARESHGLLKQATRQTADLRRARPLIHPTPTKLHPLIFAPSAEGGASNAD